jgi:hypothetical protein
VNRQALASGLVALVIALCAWPLIAFSMRHYLPEVDNDELMYFLLVKTFRSQGFHNGYSFTDDQVPGGPIHFNIQGPGTVPLYSQLARVVGWTNYSPYLANLLMFVPAWLLLAYALRGHPNRQIAVSLFVLVNAYFFMFLPSVMQESFHLAVATALAALWLLALDTTSLASWTCLFALTLGAMLVRYSWAVVLPCFVFSFVMQRANAWRIVPRVLAAGLASLVIGAVATSISVNLLLGWALPPAPVVTGAALSFPRIAVGFDTGRLVTNVTALLRLTSIGMFADYSRYFTVSLAATLAAFLLVVLFARRGSPARTAGLWAGVVLGGALTAQLMFYVVDGWRDFRVLLPAHAFAGLMFFSRADVGWDAWPRRNRVAAGGVIVLLIAGNMIWAARGVRVNYRQNWSHIMVPLDESGRSDFKELETYVRPGPGDSAWCKTIYAEPALTSDPRVSYLPEAFSLSVFSQFPPDHPPPLRGKYLLLSRFPVHPTERSEWRGAFERSGVWRRVADVHDYTLLQSTVNCLSSS